MTRSKFFEKLKTKAKQTLHSKSKSKNGDANAKSSKSIEEQATQQQTSVSNAVVPKWEENLELQQAQFQEQLRLQAERQRLAEERWIRDKEAAQERERQQKHARKVAALKRTEDMHERAGCPIGSPVPRTMDYRQDVVAKSPVQYAGLYESQASETTSASFRNSRASVIRAQQQISLSERRQMFNGSENWSRYEAETGMVDPMILRWD